MGDQFKPEQSHLLQKAYGAFYWSINLGSFFSFLVIPAIKNHKGYSLAFLVPGILMGIATFVFWMGTKYYTRIPPSRETKTAGFFDVFFAAHRQYASPLIPVHNLMTTIGLPLIATVGLLYFSVSATIAGSTTQVARYIGWISLVCAGLWYASVVISSMLGKLELPDGFWQGARDRYGEKEINAARSVGPILFVFALIPVFFSLFDQTNSTWVLQGEKMVPFNFLGYTIGAEEMQSANPLLVMILVPLMTILLYPRIGKFASPLRRMSLGMFVAAGSYIIVALIQSRIEAGAQISVLWQFVPYTILTIAEVFVSTTGLEFAFREAAPEMKSLVMSFWLLTIALGDLLVAAITELFAGPTAGGSVSTSRFLLYAGLTFVVAILFSIVAAHYRYRDQAAAQGK